MEYIRGRTRLPREDVITVKPISTIPFEFEIFWEVNSETQCLFVLNVFQENESVSPNWARSLDTLGLTY